MTTSCTIEPGLAIKLLDFGWIADRSVSQPHVLQYVLARLPTFVVSGRLSRSVHGESLLDLVVELANHSNNLFHAPHLAFDNLHESGYVLLMFT